MIIKSREVTSFCDKATIYEDEDAIVPGEALTIELTRGCRFRCKFCSYPLNGRKTNDYFRDQNSLYLELLQNYEKHGVTRYFFSDDTYNESTEKLLYLKKFSNVFHFRSNSQPIFDLTLFTMQRR